MTDDTIEQMGLGIGEQPRTLPRSATASSAVVTESDRDSARLLLDAVEQYVANSRATVRAAAVDAVASVFAFKRETTVSCAVVRAEREREAAAEARTSRRKR